MGVHGLWPVLAPAAQSLPLSRLAGRTLAVDLSGWVCQALRTKGLQAAVPKPHLRNLFFRVASFYRHGASLVFVVDGEATQLKWSAMDSRMQWDGSRRNRGRGRRTGRRSKLQSYVNECCHLLDCLGVPYLQSKGEAEGLCSLLNAAGLTDGVLTDDSDAFLYGASTVYRDLITSDRSSQVECYTLAAIQETLGLHRQDLIAMALLLGCDYCPEGVAGVGKEKTLQFIRACKSHDKSCDLLDMFRQWKAGTITEENVATKCAKAIYRKAMDCAGFPNEEVISEFLISKDTVPKDPGAIANWRLPQLLALKTFCQQHMEWNEGYTTEKVTPLLTQWMLRQASQGNKELLIVPKRIVKERKHYGVKNYEVQWIINQEYVQEGERTLRDLFSNGTIITLELETQMKLAFPAICTAYVHSVEEQAEEKTQLKAVVLALNKQKPRTKKGTKVQKSDQNQKLVNSPPLQHCLHQMLLDSPPDHGPCIAFHTNHSNTKNSHSEGAQCKSDVNLVGEYGSAYSPPVVEDLDSENEFPNLTERLKMKGVLKSPQDSVQYQPTIFPYFRSIRSNIPKPQFQVSSSAQDLKKKEADSTSSTAFNDHSTLVMRNKAMKSDNLYELGEEVEDRHISTKYCDTKDSHLFLGTDISSKKKILTDISTEIPTYSHISDERPQTNSCNISPKKVALSTPKDLPAAELIVIENSSDKAEGHQDPLEMQRNNMRKFPRKSSLKNVGAVGTLHNPIVIN